MKKIIFALGLFLLAGNIYAQTDARAKTILAGVSQQYKSYQTIKADFALTIENPAAKVKNTQQGTLYAKSKTNQYKVIMPGQELISNGKTQWTYQKEDKEVQVTTVDNNSNDLNPTKIFTLYETGFKYIYNGEEKSGANTYQMIDLTPTDAKKSIFKVRLSINKAKKQIAKAVLFDKNGSKYTYLVKSFSPNVKVPESNFVFDAKKYPGVEVVDLR